MEAKCRCKRSGVLWQKATNSYSINANTCFVHHCCVDNTMIIVVLTLFVVRMEVCLFVFIPVWIVVISKSAGVAVERAGDRAMRTRKFDQAH